MDESVRLRPAVPSEAANLSALALRSKAYWGYSVEFIAACTDELTYRPEQIVDEKFNFMVAELDGRVAGFYALEKITNSQFELDALFVEPQQIGKGIGRTLIRDAIKNVRKQNGESVLIQGDPNAERFYLAAGARVIGARESGSVSGRQLPLFEITLSRAN